MRRLLPWVLGIGLVVWASAATGASPARFIGGLGDMGGFLRSMWPPDFSEVAAVWPDFVLTLRMALVATVAGALIAYPLAVLAAGNTTTVRPVNLLARIVLNLVRSVPDLLLAALAVALYGAKPAAGAIALTLFTAGIIGKLLYESLETIAKGPLEAATAVGAPWLARVRYGAMPLVLPQFLSYCLYVLELNVRVASIVGLVGAGGIGLWLNINFDLGQYPRVAALLATLFVVVSTIDALSTRLRQRLLGK